MSIGRLLGILAICLTLAAGVIGCRYRIRAFVIVPEMEPGWVAVVLSDHTCTEPAGSPFETRIVIPVTGYVCTSMPVVQGHVIEHYYRQLANGTLKELELDRQIFVPATTEIRSGSCHLFAETFWYGPREKMQGDPSTVVLKNRKECQ